MGLENVKIITSFKIFFQTTGEIPKKLQFQLTSAFAFAIRLKFNLIGLGCEKAVAAASMAEISKRDNILESKSNPARDN